MSRPQGLHDVGVSLALDTLSRDLLESGDFAGCVGDFAVSGATSNPTIFAKVITGSERYDDPLRSLLSAGLADPRELFVAVALDDVRRAAAVLRPSYERADGNDGLVSFACTPNLADDADGTIAQALDVRRRLDLANALIKVPATRADVAAVAELAPAPAPAVGDHGDQGPGLLRRALRRAAPRAGRDDHDARAEAARVRRQRRGRGDASRRARRAGGCAARGRRGGVDLRAITAELERQGVAAFCDSYRQLLGRIESKLGALSAVA
jgi:hypothetical protein